MQRHRSFKTMVRPARCLRAAAWSLALLGLACHNPDDYALNSEDSPAIDRFLTLAADGATTLPADGVSAVELVARVLDVTEGPLTVQFVTTAGSLRVGTTVGSVATIDSLTTAHRPDSVVVRTDADGEARVELVSSTQPASAQVRATVLGVDATTEQVLRIDFAAAPAEALVAFVDPPDSAYAHGLSLVPVTVRIGDHLQGAQRDVSFETTGGVFPFADDSSGVQVVRADADGQATAYLRSPESPGPVQVRARVAGISQEHVIRFVPAPADSVLRFVEATPAAPADGETLTGFTVVLSPRLQDLADRTVVFTTTRGSFLFPQSEAPEFAAVRANADGEATAWLRSPTGYGEAVVRAGVLGFTQDARILFDWAGPDSIVVRPEAGGLRITTGEQVLVQAELLRLESGGQVTTNLPVEFTATDSLGNPLAGARFLDVKRTDAVGVATATFVVETTEYQGRATISARPSRSTSNAVGQTQVTILRP